MIPFIIKSTLSLLVFYGLYWLLLRKERLFVFTRFFLLFSLIISLIIPFISFPVIINESADIGKVFMSLDHNIQSWVTENGSLNGIDNGPVVSEQEISGKSLVPSLLAIIYLTVMSLLLIRFLKNVDHIITKIKVSEKLHFDDYRIILIDDRWGPHCFFRNIFLNRTDYFTGRIDGELLNHELGHVRQFHSLDIMLIEFYKIFYWFNPVSLMYDRAIRINHEFLADRCVVDSKFDIRTYIEKIFSFMPEGRIPLTSGSGHSNTKRRLMMLTKPKPGVIVQCMKIAATIVMAGFVILIMGFRNSDLRIAEEDQSQVQEAASDNAVRGIVMGVENKPLRLVTVVVIASGKGMQTGSDGRFVLSYLDNDATLEFSCIGYKNKRVKPDFSSEMIVTMEKDPDYRGTVATPDASYLHEGEYVTIKVTDDNEGRALLILDGRETEYMGEIKLKRENIGGGKILRGREAIEKYGERGKYGVVEIITREKAAELGIEPPEPRQSRMNPEDYPTFQGAGYEAFEKWIAKNTLYPGEASVNKTGGRVRIGLTVEPDGSLSNISSIYYTNKLLKDAVVEAVKRSPGWEPAKNPAFRSPFPIQIAIKFEMPDKITADDVLVSAEIMPSYPGGEAALLKHIQDNLNYPAQAKEDRIQGRVIVSFIVNRDGKMEDVSVIRSVDPLLDAEAKRVVEAISVWKPAMNSGTPVSVYYTMPVVFTLDNIIPVKASLDLPGKAGTSSDTLLSENSVRKIFQYIYENVMYPDEAKNASDTGRIFVAVKVKKGGLIKECNAFTSRSEIKTRLLNEIVITGYKKNQSAVADSEKKVPAQTEHASLIAECCRVVNSLGKVDIPEWQEKDMEFALAFRFMLK